MSHRKFSALLAGAVVALAGLAGPAAAEDAGLRAAVAGDQRGAAHVARDPHRHPYESLVFWGLAPGQTVIELSPGSGYWTEILAPYAKATGGQYVAAVADLDNPQLSEAAKRGRAAFAEKFSNEAVFGKVVLANFGPNSKPLGAPASADLVLTARNIHNFMYNEGMLDKVMADAYAVLKPGGILAVEEHRADPRPEAEGVRDGYVATATVVDAARKAGFVLEESSEVNANPKDTKDHPFGVWTLPPVRRSAAPGQQPDPAFDRAKYDAIGESDRMTLRFRKPS